MDKQGFFLTVEGGEGAGKSSVIALLQQDLVSRGHRVVTTREPGGIVIAEQIRSVILNPQHTAMDGRTEALLYAAARRQHLVEKIIPALAAGEVVVCDRFIDSSLAYQGYARGLGIEEVWQINRFAVERTMPDLTLLLDIEPEAGLARIEADGTREVNRLDLESLAFHQKVRTGYLQLAERFPERIRIVNAEQSLDQVLGEIWSVLEPFLQAPA